MPDRVEIWLLALHTPPKTFWLQFDNRDEADTALAAFREGNDKCRDEADISDTWMLWRFNMKDEYGHNISVAFSSVVCAEVIEQGANLRWQANVDKFVEAVRAEAKPRAGFSTNQEQPI